MEERVITGPMTPRYTLADVRRSYSPEKAWAEMRDDFPCYLIWRPLSFYVTPLALRLGIPILAVTLSSLVAALAMVTIAWYGGAHATLAVAFLGAFFHVADCLDGNMARTLGRTSRFGGLVDGVVDMTFWALLYVSTGLLVQHLGGGILGEHALEFALGLPILVLLHRLARDNYTHTYAQTYTSTYAATFESESELEVAIPDNISIGEKFMIAVAGLEFLYVFFIAIGGVFGVLDYVLVGMGLYVAAIFVGAIVLTFTDAWRDEKRTEK